MTKFMLDNGYLTNGDIANILGIGRATVSRWIDSGKLKIAFALPSVKAARKIEVEELRRFLKANRMPTIEKFLEMKKITVILETVEIKIENRMVKMKVKRI